MVTDFAPDDPYVDQPLWGNDCQCDRFKHEHEACPNQPEDHGDIIAAPRLCTACLFYCWADV